MNMLEVNIEKVNLAELKQKIEKELKRRENKYNMAITALKGIYDKFEGKQINRRIHTFVKQLPEFDGYTVYFERIASLINLVIWGKDFDYRNRWSIFLGYSSEPIINSEKLKEHNAGWYLERERIDNIKTALKDLKKYVVRWNKIIHDAESLYDDLDKIDGLGYYFSSD